MRIAIVHSFYASKVPSGENVVVEAQVNLLRRAGFEVELVKVQTDDLYKSPLYALRSAKNVATGCGLSPVQELRKFKPDVVHVHNLFPNYSTAWLKHWVGPIVTTQHNYRPLCAAGTLLRNSTPCSLCPEHGSHHAVVNACYKNSRTASLPLAIRNRNGVEGDKLLSRADRVILLSERSKTIYAAAGLELEKTRIIPNFVDGRGFSPEKPIGRDWIYIGRLTAEKGVQKLVQHWPSGKTLRIFGDGPLMSSLRQQSPPNISFEGSIDRERVPTVLAASRGLIFPSLCAEGAVPLTYVEALAAARPVVAFEGNGAADDVILSRSGEVFSEWSRLQEALDKVESQEQGYGTSARSHYESDFTPGRWLEATTKLYDDVLSEASV
jgi:glycosyltransferase involved in cell wall biosynthesis